MTLCKRLPPACKGVESYLKLALFAANMVIVNNSNTPFYFFDEAAWAALSEPAPPSPPLAQSLSSSSGRGGNSVNVNELSPGKTGNNPLRLLERYMQERPRGAMVGGNMGFDDADSFTTDTNAFADAY